MRLMYLFGTLVTFTAAAAATAQTCDYQFVQRNPVTPGMPGSQNGGYVAFDSVRGRTLMYANGFANCCPRPETWEWDGNTWMRTDPLGPRPARSPAIFAFDAARNQAVVFSGVEPFQPPTLTDTWVYSTETGLWQQVFPETSPPARVAAAYAYDEARQEVLMFGGVGPNGPLGDTWAWNGINWALRSTEGPSPRSSRMAYDHATQRVVLFSGNPNDCCTFFHDTWVWDGVSWTEIPMPKVPLSPAGRGNQGMAFDPIYGGVIMRGGGQCCGPADAGQTWLFRDNQWIDLGTGGLDAFGWTSMVYDSVRERVVNVRQSTDPGETGRLMYESGAFFSAESAELGPFGAGSPQSLGVTQPPQSVGDVALYLRARGDLGAGLESVSVLVNGTPAGTAFGPGGTDCPATFDRDTVFIPRKIWNAATLAGSIQIDLVPSAAVNPAQCASFVQVRVEYHPRPQFDCNGNNIEDACDLANGTSEDKDGDERPDECGSGGIVIVEQPASAVVRLGAPVTLSVEATGPGTLSYAWLKNGSPLVNGPGISGVQTAQLSLAGAGFADAGSYSVVITTDGLFAMSTNASLSVLAGCPADFDQSGTLNSADFFAFLTQFFTGCP